MSESRSGSIRDLPEEERQSLLRAKLDEMWENNEIPTWRTFEGSAAIDDAATAVLDIVAPLSYKYDLEIFGHIVPHGEGYRFTRPQVGYATRGALNTAHIGYHTHPSGSLRFSNDDWGVGGNDARWVRQAGKPLYLGVRSNTGSVGIAVCEPGSCNVAGRMTPVTGRIIRGF